MSKGNFIFEMDGNESNVNSKESKMKAILLGRELRAISRPVQKSTDLKVIDFEIKSISWRQ